MRDYTGIEMYHLIRFLECCRDGMSCAAFYNLGWLDALKVAHPLLSTKNIGNGDDGVDTALLDAEILRLKSLLSGGNNVAVT